jgi:hypothetical protein
MFSRNSMERSRNSDRWSCSISASNSATEMAAEPIAWVREMRVRLSSVDAHAAGLGQDGLDALAFMGVGALFSSSSEA